MLDFLAFRIMEMKPISPPSPVSTCRSSTEPGCRSKWSVASTSERLLWLIITPFRAIFCVSNVTIFFVTYFGFMAPIWWAKSLWPRFYWYYEGKLYMWLQSFIGYWGYTADYDGKFFIFFNFNTKSKRFKRNFLSVFGGRK